MNNVLLQLGEKEIVAITGKIRERQLLSALNFARQYINTQGSFDWDFYYGSIITVSGIKSYVPTPQVYNYIPTSRTTANATAHNVTVSPMYAASFDDTFNLAKCVATGATPSLSRTSAAVGASGAPVLSSMRVSASIWLCSDATLPSGDITLTLSDDTGGQAVTQTISGSPSNLQRYGISGYFDGSQDDIKLKVSWANTDGIVYVDAWQAENNDWPSEVLHNATTLPLIRTTFADVDRLHSIIPFIYEGQIQWQQLIYPSQSVLPYDHTTPWLTNIQRMSVKAGLLNLENVADGTHLVYRGKKRAPIFTLDTDLIDIPDPEYWILLHGVVAYIKAAIYDIGTNTEAETARKRFELYVQDMVMTSGDWPGWTSVDIVSPVMMR